MSKTCEGLAPEIKRRRLEYAFFKRKLTSTDPRAKRAKREIRRRVLEKEGVLGIPQVGSYTYLGILMTPHACPTTAVQDRLAKARSSWATKVALWGNKKIALRLKRKLLHVYVMSVLFYGLCALPIGDQEDNLIKRFAREMEARLLQCKPWNGEPHDTNSTRSPQENLILLEAAEEFTTKRLDKLRLNFLGHMIRGPDSAITMDLLAPGNVNPYKSLLERNSLSAEDALDRVEWRRVVTSL